MGAFTVGAAKTVAAYSPTSGTKLVQVQLTGPASYDTGGSVVNLGTVAGKEVLSISVKAQGAVAYQAQYVPAANNAPATGKLFVADGGGTQITSETALNTIKFDALIVCTDA